MGIKWVRPRDLLNSTPQPGRNHPSLYGPKGVQVRTSEQRDLGDCWFLSSATAVAEDPSRIEAIFNNVRDYNANGAFQMFFYVRGEKVAVHIDDRIPLRVFGPGYKTYYYWLNNGASQDGAWWLVLLEKAFAKLNVNYSNINGGWPGEALRYLTGAPIVNYHPKDFKNNNDLLWKIVTEGMNKNYPMVGGTYQNNSAFNVTDGHAETCLGSLILRNPDGSEHAKLIKMRNPWGRYTYTGPWSNSSDLWTPEFKKQADFGEADHGIFYTPLENWTSEFENLTVAHTGDWKVNSIEGKTSAYTSQGTKWTNEFVWLSNPVKQDVFVECD